MTEFYRDRLPGGQKLVYDAVYRGLMARKEAIVVPYSHASELNTVIHALMADHPEIAWTDGRWRCAREMTDVVYPVYVLNAEEISAFLNEINLWNSRIKAKGGLSAVNLMRWVFDQLLETVVYDLSAEHSQTAYGALVEHRAVCRGISKAFQLIMESSGIPATAIEGTLNGEAAHVWNIVCLDGEYYHLDVTMGFPEFSFLYESKGLDYCRDAAFCVSDDTLSRTHRWDPNQLKLKCMRDL